jgi:O-antigen ligase
MSHANAVVAEGPALRAWRAPVALALGLLGGLAIAFAESLETRWVVYLCAVPAFLVVLIAAPDKRALLTAGFVLSLQINVAYRLFFGRAGSAGLALWMPTLLALPLLLYPMLFSPAAAERPRLAGRLALPLALLFVTTGFSLLTTEEQFVGLARFVFDLQLFLVYCAALNAVRSEVDVELIMKWLLISLGIQSIVYLAQSFMGVTFTLVGEVRDAGDIPRPGGTVATNPAGFASFILPPLLMCMASLMLGGSRLKRTALGVLTVAGIIGVLITFTRAAWGAFALGSAILLYFGFRQSRVGARLALLIGGTVLLGLALLAPLVTARLTQAPLDESYEERRALMVMAMRVIAARPITGVGPGAYAHDYKSYLTAELDDYWLYTVHNEFLLRAAETGVPGMLAFAFLLMTALRLAREVARARSATLACLGVAAMAAIPALMFQMSWVNWTGFAYNAMLWCLLGLVDGASLVQRRSETPLTSPA